MAAAIAFTPRRFLVQWSSCLALVFLTYNPFGRSYYHWVTGASEDLFFKLSVGLLLLFIYVFLFWVIFGSVGLWGLVAGILIGLLCIHQILQWFLVEIPAVAQAISLLLMATLLAVGLAWPHLTIQLSGQPQKRYLVKGKKKLAKYMARYG